MFLNALYSSISIQYQSGLEVNMKLLVCIGIGPLDSLHCPGSVFPKDHLPYTLQSLK